jgi:linker histone H1 and H5 family protein
MPALASRAVRSRRQVPLVVACHHLIDIRPQYAEEKYRLDMTSASNLHQLNLALTRGAEKETFVFPKGPSGKVKLAPKRPRAAVDAKEVLSSAPF